MKHLLTTLVLLTAISLSAQETVQVFILAGQSNMQGYGKIYDGSNGAIGAVMGSFTPSCPDPETSCDFTFNMLDGYGDGWNGWTYDFVQDGVVMATETLANGTEGTVTVTLEAGVLCEVVVNSAGAYAAEISWTVTDMDDTVLASMDGQEDSYPSPNTLLDVVENDVDNEWTMLQDGDDWAVFDDVYLYFENGSGDLFRDPVTIGQGAHPEFIGPELMFAHEMDEYFDDPVLIIKAAWGGLSLGEDFRPPSSGGTVGPYYTEMMDMVDYVTQNLATEFPDLGLSEFELAGFAWFQGWNDAGSEDFLNEYESNLHNLINDVRNDLERPNLPFVVASAGQGGYEDHWGWTQDIQEIISVAQEVVACNDSLYGGTVGFVDTKPLYMSAEESPDNAGFHYHNNARTFLNVGKSIGEEMVRAINDMAYCDGFVSVEYAEGRPNTLSIYPNPTSGFVTIDSGQVGGHNVNYRLYDVTGKIVLESQSVNTQLIDLSICTTGTYILEVDTGERVFRSRVVVE